MARLMGDFGGPIFPNFVFPLNPPPRFSFAVEERGPRRGGVEGGVLSSSSNLRRRRAVDGGMM